MLDLKYVFVTAQVYPGLAFGDKDVGFLAVDTPMNYHVKLDANTGELFANVGQFMQASRQPHGRLFLIFCGT